MDSFNLIIIGAGLSGQQAAMKAALFGHTVDLFYGVHSTGGGAISPATHLKKIMQRLMLLWEYTSLFEPDFSQFYTRAQQVFFSQEEDEASEAAFLHNVVHMRNVEYMQGRASFLNLDEVLVEGQEGKRTLEGRKILIATGAHPLPNPKFVVDGVRVHNGSTIFSIGQMPRALMVYGGSFRALEYASVFAFCGCAVQLILPDMAFLEVFDEDIVAAVLEQVERLGITVHPMVDVESLSTEASGVTAVCGVGKEISADAFLDLSLWGGPGDALQTEAAGIDSDDLGFIKVTPEFRTNIPHIYAIGEAVHAPALATVCMNEGRLSVSKMFGLKDVEQLSELYPLQLSLTSPLAVAGESERALKEREIKYVIGRARFSDNAKGHFLGMAGGFMKLLVRHDTEEIVGVQIMGRNARELIHFGMELITNQVTVGKVIGSVFSEYTLHQIYRAAALEALYKLRGKGA